MAIIKFEIKDEVILVAAGYHGIENLTVESAQDYYKNILNESILHDAELSIRKTEGVKIDALIQQKVDEAKATWQN